MRNDNGTTDGERRDVFLELVLEGRSATVCEADALCVVAGIEDLAAVNGRDRAMDLVGTRLCDLVDDGSARTAVLGGEVAGLKGDFLKGIVVGDGILRTSYGNVVVLQTVDQEIVGSGTGTVDPADAAIKRAALV